MAVRTVFLVLPLALVSNCAGIGLPCMQRDIVLNKLSECYSGISGVSVDKLKFHGSAASNIQLVNDKTCSQESAIVTGMDCFFNFYGNCLNMRSVFPSVENIKNAVSLACNNIEALNHPCVESLAMEMMRCTMQKSTERKMDIMAKRVKVNSIEDEACRAYRIELECLRNSSSACPRASSDAFYNFLNDLVPFSCKRPNLLKILKDHLQSRHVTEKPLDGPR